MKKFEAHDLHHLRAATGWLELGNHLEANAELENITPELRGHPDVLELRWQICAKDGKWDACRDIADAITKQDPARASGWIDLAYAARRVDGGTVQAARDILLSVAGRFSKEPLIPYNLACYSCQLGNLKEARRWLEKALEIGNADQLKLMALDEPDLEPLWKEIGK